MKRNICILFLLIGNSLIAQNCLPGWDYYRPLSINNPSGDNLSDCAIRVPLNTGELVIAGKLQANGADLRITDTACNVLPYFIDSLATDTVNFIWVKVPAIAANDTLDLQLYYGNAAADSFANGDSTFLFFDDFSADTVNPAKWEPFGGYAKLEVIDGVLNYASNGSNPGSRFKFVRTKMSFQEAVYFDFNAKISNSNGFGFCNGDNLIQRIIFRQSAFGFDTLNQVAYMSDTVSNGIQVEGMYPFIRYPRGEFRDAQILAGIEDSLLTMRYFANLNDNSASDSLYQLTQTKMGSFHFIVSSFQSSQTVFLDYLRVRKPVPDTVNSSIGPETMIFPSSLAELNSELLIQISPNPASRQLSIEGLPSGNFAFQLLNVQGQVIYQKGLTAYANQKTTIPLPEIVDGLYWASITDSKQTRNFYQKTILIQSK